MDAEKDGFIEVNQKFRRVAVLQNNHHNSLNYIKDLNPTLGNRLKLYTDEKGTYISEQLFDEIIPKILINKRKKLRAA